ncbi:MAG TPA: GTPase HflX [Alphaproteobacteria bacterium]
MSDSVVIVQPVFKSKELASQYDATAQMAEAEGLARAIDLDVIDVIEVNVPKPNPATLITLGGVEKAMAVIEPAKPDVIFFNGALSPVQQRNLEKAWNAKVIDRTGLILEIFADRAQTREGTLQVDLAMLEYQRSRLVKSWTHLERQRATGKTGGPGETQIEIDRRLLDTKMAQIKKQIEHVRNTRDLQRRARERVPYPLVAIVGYTNAGKSTLFNRLTGASVLAKDMLFATLDTTSRALKIPGGQKIILSDTVGFITDLPTQLVAAFRATLEQVTQADIILHMQDVSDPNHAKHRKDVLDILDEIGVDLEKAPIIDVFNKVDLLPAGARSKYGSSKQRGQESVNISAISGDGIEALLLLIKTHLDQGREVQSIKLPVSEGKWLAWLHAHGEVVADRVRGENRHLKVALSQADFDKYNQTSPFVPKKSQKNDWD